MPRAVLLRRSPIGEVRSGAILKSYASRAPPREAAKCSGVSRNTARQYYRLIRARLTDTGYYTETPRSIDDTGLAGETVTALKRRRGVREADVPYHAAEIVEWIDEYPPCVVLKHIRKIVDLAGPLDVPRKLSEAEREKLQAYIRYARTELVHHRAATSKDESEFQIGYIARADIALKKQWRAYRTVSKRVERDRL